MLMNSEELKNKYKDLNITYRNNQYVTDLIAKKITDDTEKLRIYREDNVVMEVDKEDILIYIVRKFGDYLTILLIFSVLGDEK